LLDIALQAVDLGLSVLPPRQDGSKAPIADVEVVDDQGEVHYTWAPYQTTPAAREHVLGWYRGGNRTGLGLVCGVKNLEGFEFDCQKTYQEFKRAAGELGLAELVAWVESGYSEKTPGGGTHWLIYCAPVRGSTKLACKPKAGGKPGEIDTLIETRGRGAYLIISPTNGKVHPSGLPYVLLDGGLDTIRTITSQERDILDELARSFDEMPEQPAQRKRPSLTLTTPPSLGGRPGDDFEERTGWEEILEPHGWTKVFTRGKVTFWRRPGKEEKHSATTGYCRGLKVFSTSTPFPTEGTTTKFGVYAILNHQGDFKAAAEALRRAGYGTSSSSAKGQPFEPDDDQEEYEVIDRWPTIKDEAFHGIAGELVALIDPHTEADRAAILIQLLVTFSNMLGRLAYFRVSASRHYLNLFAALVGATASGRKGTAWDIVAWLLERLDATWASERVQSGLISGEGLIHAVRDAGPAPKAKGSGLQLQSGVDDKRLMIIETEMGRVLKSMNREGNVLSEVIRQAWDSGRLRTMPKASADKATGAFISIVAHVTMADVVKHLTKTDSSNGFGNRFLWLAVRRSKLLPDGGDLESIDWLPIVHRLQQIVSRARRRGEHKYKRDAAANKLWRTVYERLSSQLPGLLGFMLSRAEAQVMRLACVFAVLDQADLVQVEHLQAALALWDYCVLSARLVFGEPLGDPDADRLLDAIKTAPDGLTRKQISDDVFCRNKQSKDIATLLSDLLLLGIIHRVMLPSTGGRRAELWRLGMGT
jgi:hypothetical protein